nr:DUF1801 domain-containing protein [Aquisalinus flavus]
MTSSTKQGATPTLLSGGNPQIPKGVGDAPVQAWIAAAPGWKGDLAVRIDAIIAEMVPDAEKAVKWNSPFYGVEQGRWFASLHCYTKFLRVTFFDGSALNPPPKKTSKYERVRYHDIPEGGLDEAQFADWIAQAAALPGEKL